MNLPLRFAGTLRKPLFLLLGLASLAFIAFLAACGDEETSGPEQTGTPPQRLSGRISIDGSSTVFPITEAVAEEFRKVQSGVDVTVGISGTGGGFQKFCNGETAISDASRPIKQSEIDACKARGIEFVELPVAFDALSVMVNPRNNFVECLTVAELKKIWEPAAQGNITNWSQVRAGFPNQALKLYGPGTDSGTFDYFTEAIVGKEDSSRGDFVASEDDNVLVQGISGDQNALGYFGFAYYVENQNKLKALAIDGGQGCVMPSKEAVENGTYKPLSRPIFIYVRRDVAERPEVKAFVDFYIKKAPELVDEVGYVPLPKSTYALVSQRFNNLKTGTMLAGGSQGLTLEELLRRG
ncbi:MAG TPA: PstS family phosphate ABC transporter substrate-binding protein [Dehalococcoidia bacterium]|nr:PstS family phosphate ABC transporter substrate-binding protein [Dehalococcoidia bacterium]